MSEDSKKELDENLAKYKASLDECHSLISELRLLLLGEDYGSRDKD
tara:strand:- start:620 stop:757 length:138 start_codon:yes stop_codon:yes gene_type:complete